MRDVLRKYFKNSKTFELLKLINADITKKINLPESKSALLFIVGEYADKINSSVEILNIFAVNFHNENEKVKAQILNAAIKNFVVKPNSSEDITKYVLEKAGEECENPDIRDRAYIYWRLLENDPDAAKEILLGEKPSFIFQDEEKFDKTFLDDLVENLTNISCLYQKKSSDMISPDDLIVENTNNENDNEAEDDKNLNDINNTEDSNIDSSKKEKQIKSKKNKIIETKINTNDFDLLGLGDSSNTVTTINSNPNLINLDIMDIFGVANTNTNKLNNTNSNNIINNIINQDFSDSNENKPKKTNKDNHENSFNLSVSNQSSIQNTNITNDVFSDIQFLDEDENSENNIFSFKTGVSQPKPYKALDKTQRGKNGVYGLYVSGLFHRENQRLFLGLHLKNDFHLGMNNFLFEIPKNIFGIYLPESDNKATLKDFYLNSENERNLILDLKIEMNNSLNVNLNENNGNNTSPLMIDILLKNNLDDFNLKVPFYLNCLNSENGKMTNQNFMEYFKKFSQNKIMVNYTNNLKTELVNEEALNKCLEKNNIFMVAKNSKLDPPVYFYSGLIQSNMPYIFEISFIKGIFWILR